MSLRASLTIVALTAAVSMLPRCDRSDDDADFLDGELGAAAALFGDLDGDGNDDLLVGAPGTEERGMVRVVTVYPNGSATLGRQIGEDKSHFRGDVDVGDRFGEGVARLEDLDGDGVDDLAVGAPGDGRGAVWILFLDPTGLVGSWQKIAFMTGGFTGPLLKKDLFGSSLTALGDLDGDGISDFASGAPRDNDGGTDRGAVWVLFLNADGTVRTHQKVSALEGGFTGALDDHDRFGSSVGRLGDLDGDGVEDLAVGAPLDDDGGKNTGAVWILSLNRDGTVKETKKISSTEGGLNGTLRGKDYFGSSLVSLGDLDGDGIQDLAVGAENDRGDFNRGAVWILFLRRDGTVKSHAKINRTDGGFTGTLANGDYFGSSLTLLPDLDGNGVPELAVGARGDHEDERGAIWVLFLTAEGRVKGQVKTNP